MRCWFAGHATCTCFFHPDTIRFPLKFAGRKAYITWNKLEALARSVITQDVTKFTQILFFFFLNLGACFNLFCMTTGPLASGKVANAGSL